MARKMAEAIQALLENLAPGSAGRWLASKSISSSTLGGQMDGGRSDLDHGCLYSFCWRDMRRFVA